MTNDIVCGKNPDGGSLSAAKDGATTANIGLTRMDMSSKEPWKVTVPEGAGPGPKPAASPPRKVQVKMLRTSRESSDSDEELEHERTYLAGPGPKEAAPPPRRVQVKMLRTSRESSDSDEEPEHEWPYLLRARVEQPIDDV